MKLFKLLILLSLLLSFHLVSAEGNIPSFDQPVNPDLYLIRPGDTLQVTFIKSKIKPIKLMVDPEGKIVDETLGIFDLSHTSLTQARVILGKSLKENYKVNEIAVSITNPRLVSVSVTGKIVRPGIYKGYSSQRVSEIIKKAGGILYGGSQRGIVFSGGVRDLKVDLDVTNYLNSLDFDPYLYAGYSLYIPNRSDNLVQVIGEVNKPREIELLPDDNVSKLIALAGGVTRFADTTAVKIISPNDHQTKKTLEVGDIILVPPRKKVGSELKVAVFGAVTHPGYYPFTSKKTLIELIQDAGDFLSQANKGLTTIFRKPAFDYAGKVTELRFPISHLMDAKNESSFGLQVEDSVFVPINVGYVRVSGAVFNPGYFPYVKGEEALFYINNAGGFIPSTRGEEIFIYNPIAKMSSKALSKTIVDDGSEIIVRQIKESQ